MKAALLVESLTGNTWKAAELIADDLTQEGWTITGLAKLRQPDLAAIQDADMVLVGTWVHGLFVFGQTPWAAGDDLQPAGDARQAGRRVLHVRPQPRQEPGEAHRRRRRRPAPTSSAAWPSAARKLDAHSEVFASRLVAPIGRRLTPGVGLGPRRGRRPSITVLVDRGARSIESERSSDTTGNTPSGGASVGDVDAPPVAVDERARAPLLLDGARRVAVGGVGPVHAPPGRRVVAGVVDHQRPRPARRVQTREQERPVLGDRRGPGSTLPSSNVVGARRSVDSAPPGR